MRLMDLMEPEETVGNLWHGLIEGMGAQPTHPEAAMRLADLRPSLALLLRALGARAGVEIVEAPATPVRHRTALRRRIGSGRESEHVAAFDGERLRLPPCLDLFPEARLNRAAYFWLTALAAVSAEAFPDLPESDGPAMDCAQIRANAFACDRAYRLCPGLRTSYRDLARLSLALRTDLPRPAAEAAMEQALRDQLATRPGATQPAAETAGRYMPLAPVPIWLRFLRRDAGPAADGTEEEAMTPPPAIATTSRKRATRRDLDQTRRNDGFIIHRFEAILSWVEAMNLNRSVDDDEDDNAAKAAEDQEEIALTRHDRKAASRLKLHLDLSPADALHEALAGSHVYPEWNHRTRSYMEGHVRVLDAPARPDGTGSFRADPRQIRAVRRQFETLRPRRLLRPRQVDGSEIDLDALICTRADLLATGRGSDRIWQEARQVERDLAVAFLLDTSRSTEAAIGDTSVIDVARAAMSALASGLDAAGDRFAIWGFSSLRRDRVFLTRVKDFADPMGAPVLDNIAALRPGHYTRLGAAIRHVGAELARETAARRLLIVLTDGKPNDLDHYEGRHGIEDSHMAVREARRAGLTLHGVIVDEDGQDWFARIFGRGGFTLLPHPGRLTRALPDIYRSLTQET
ncbi:nitric oxide reductase activation protein NorD [Celeribacter indicus]|uniref:Protein NorD n=1 Tax=Celeribacter indicus TaxID=1208324 RepID=A0A0B5DRD8_9RHOB|nr:VWA domain-containing protein [Celeribacter indicus]AJE45629.1 protein NorD [Celeribacter indicus]SDW84185.1 nitric oxide reductase NorD protein [Celeribacter indicus]